MNDTMEIMQRLSGGQEMVEESFDLDRVYSILTATPKAVSLEFVENIKNEITGVGIPLP